MDLKECYQRIGGDYDNILKRFRREKMIEKFCFKFLDDPSYATYLEKMKAQEYEEALRAIHSLKGVCSNLAFNRLYEISAAIVTDLRQNDPTNAVKKNEDLETCYRQTVQTILAYKSANGK